MKLGEPFFFLCSKKFYYILLILGENVIELDFGAGLGGRISILAMIDYE
jgi:hypothetical protein